MGFVTKIDYSNNRQIKQFEKTETNLSGSTTFGLPFSALTSGAGSECSGVTETLFNIVSTFSGNTGSTVFNFGDSRMAVGASELIVIDDTNSGVTQNTGNVFVGYNSIVIDGNTSYLNYSGVSYDLSVTNFEEVSAGVFTGETTTDILEILSACSLDFTGRTIWVDVEGITKTKDLIITNNAQDGYVWTASGTTGEGSWQPASGGGDYSDLNYHGVLTAQTISSTSTVTLGSIPFAPKQLTQITIYGLAIAGATRRMSSEKIFTFYEGSLVDTSNVSIYNILGDSADFSMASSGSDLNININGEAIGRVVWKLWYYVRILSA
jgi:hypothetical protein